MWGELISSELIASYHQHVNPHLGKVLSALRLDKIYIAGDGAWLQDTEQRRYVDFIAGFGALPFGHNPPFMYRAITDYLSAGIPSIVQPSVLAPATLLAQRLAQLAPSGLEYCWLTNSGAEAVEAALKACRSATRRAGVIYAHGSFHGKTMGALAVTGAQKYQRPFFTSAQDLYAVTYGDKAALRACLEQHQNEIACVILEPVQGEGGVVVPPPGYLRAVRQLCDEFGVLLVLDEVQTGLGRTGRLFAAEHEAVSPDALCLSKALSGGLVPIGCCLLNQRAFCEDMGLYHSSTFAGNGLACASALAALEALSDPTSGLLAQVEARGQQLRTGMTHLANLYPQLVRSVRGQGLMLGVEIHFKRASPRQSFGSVLETLSLQGNLIPVLSSYLLNVHGVRTAPTLTSGHVLRVQPPLIVTEEQCILFIEALEQALHLLARGDTGSLIEHLILDEHEQAQPHVIANADESLGDSWPEAQPGDARIAFLIHILDERSMMEFDASLQRYSERALRRVAQLAELFLQPFIASRARVLSCDESTSTQTPVYCEFIAIPKLPDTLRAYSNEAAELVVAEGLLMARERGAQLVGLGAYTSVVTQGGTRATKYGVSVTSGNTYTVLTAIAAVEDAAMKLGLQLEQARIVVIGAAGMIGSSLVESYLGRVGHLSLIGNPQRPENSERRMLKHIAASLVDEVVNNVERQAFFQDDARATELFAAAQWEDLAAYLLSNESDLALSYDVQADAYAREADIIICATSSTDFLVDVRQLKQGAIVLDLSQPSNVDRSTLGARPDVLFIDGGVVAFPNHPDLGFDFGFPRGHGFACMAETFMLGLSQRFEHCSIGARTNRATRLMIAEMAQRHGFKLSGLRRFNRKMNDADWQSYLNARLLAQGAPLLQSGTSIEAPSARTASSDGAGHSLAWVAEPAVRQPHPEEAANLYHWLLQRHLASAAVAPALICRERQLSYAELAQLSLRAALGLQRAGVKRGDFVALLGEDTPEYVAVLLACWQLGAVAAPLNPGLSQSDHHQMLKTIKPRLILIDQAQAHLAARLMSEGYAQIGLEAVLASFDSDIDNQDFASELDLTAATVSLESPLVALFSSGSTGTPKAILHSHGDLLAVCFNYLPTIINLAAGERVFSPSRLFFGYGLNALLFALFAGGTSVLLGSAPKAATVLAALAQHQVNVLFSVPTILKLLFAEWPQQGLQLPHLRLCVSAGETLPASLYALALERFNVEIIDGIGTTEVLSTFISNRPGESRANSTGLVVPGFEVRLVNEQGQTCAVGETGSLYVRGNTLTQGIYGDPVLTRQVFGEGWFNTKDLLYMDANGHFHYVGRANDVLKINGCWVAPHQIEAALQRHALVAECAVVAVSDEFGLLRPKAFVVTKTPVEDFESLWKDLKAFAKQHIGAHQYPHLFEPVASLPRTASGKLQRAKLLDEAKA